MEIKLSYVSQGMITSQHADTKDRAKMGTPIH